MPAGLIRQRPIGTCCFEYLDSSSSRECDLGLGTQLLFFSSFSFFFFLLFTGDRTGVGKREEGKSCIKKTST